MHKAVALMSGIGIGSGLMYFLDPDRGRRRRTMVRDKVTRAANVSGSAIGKTSRDVANRATGVVSMAGRVFRRVPEMAQPRRPAFMRANWPPAWRFLAGAAGGALAFYGITRRDPLGATAGVVGAGLLARGITNRQASRLFGLRDIRRAAA